MWRLSQTSLLVAKDQVNPVVKVLRYILTFKSLLEENLLAS